MKKVVFFIGLLILNFGFIIPDDGMKDVFIHKTLLDKLEIEELEAGQRVKVTLKVVDKGREAVNIEIIR